MPDGPKANDSCSCEDALRHFTVVEDGVRKAQCEFEERTCLDRRAAPDEHWPERERHVHPRPLDHPMSSWSVEPKLLLVVWDCQRFGQPSLKRNRAVRLEANAPAHLTRSRRIPTDTSFVSFQTPFHS